MTQPIVMHVTHEENDGDTADGNRMAYLRLGYEVVCAVPFWSSSSYDDDELACEAITKKLRRVLA